MNSLVRTRFAPSPTGFMHVGGVRTALFAWLVARQAGGQFILRIEDTDQAREVQGSAEHIQKSLEWLGLKWDEGPGVDGKLGPYFQSQRLDIYKKYADKLVAEGKAYADPYSKDELETFRTQAKTNKKPFLFRDFRPETPPAWDGTQPLRLKSDPKAYAWHDEVMGDLKAGPEAVDDFILMKSDGFPTYNFAHIIDDHEMGISHVIRGQEFLASIPKYLSLYEALGFDAPAMATLPHIMAPDGNKKLSKRDGAKDILQYCEEGFLPNAFINFLASLGWNDGTEQEVFSREELIEKFDLKRVQRAGARFDERRLLWLNGAHIRELEISKLFELVENYWPEEAQTFDDVYRIKVLALVQERLKFFAELPSLTQFFFTDLLMDMTLIDDHKQLKKFSRTELKDMLEAASESLQASDFSLEDIAERLNALLEKTGQKPAVLFSFIRIATTWSPSSPGLGETLAVLGKHVALRRIDASLKVLQ